MKRIKDTIAKLDALAERAPTAATLEERESHRQKEAGRAWNRSSRKTDRVPPSAPLPQSVFVTIYPPASSALERQLKRWGAIVCVCAEFDQRRKCVNPEIRRIPLNGKTFQEIDRALARVGYRGPIERHSGYINPIATGCGVAKPGTAGRLLREARKACERNAREECCRFLFGTYDYPEHCTNEVMGWPTDNPGDFYGWPKLAPTLKKFPWIGKVWNHLQSVASKEKSRYWQAYKVALADGRIEADDSDEDFFGTRYIRERERTLLTWLRSRKQEKQTPETVRESVGAIGSATEKESLSAAIAESYHSNLPTTAVDWFPPMALVADMPVCQRQHETPVCHAKRTSEFTDSEALASIRFFFQECLTGQFFVRDSNRFWQSAPCPEGALLAIRLLIHLLLVQQTK